MTYFFLFSFFLLYIYIRYGDLPIILWFKYQYGEDVNLSAMNGVKMKEQKYLEGNHDYGLRGAWRAYSLLILLLPTSERTVYNEWFRSSMLAR